MRTSRLLRALLVVMLAIVSAGECRAGSCRADWNRNGTVSVQDLFSFLTSWYSHTGDYNRNLSTTPQDLFDFLGAFFTGCSSCSYPSSAPAYGSAIVAELGTFFQVDYNPYVDVIRVLDDGGVVLFDTCSGLASVTLARVTTTSSIASGSGSVVATTENAEVTMTPLAAALDLTRADGVRRTVAGLGARTTLSCASGGSLSVLGYYPSTTAADIASISTTTTESLAQSVADADEALSNPSDPGEPSPMDCTSLGVRASTHRATRRRMLAPDAHAILRTTCGPQSASI